MKIKDFIEKAHFGTRIVIRDLSCGTRLETNAGLLTNDDAPDWLLVAAPVLLEKEIDAWSIRDGAVSVLIKLSDGIEKEMACIGETQEAAKTDI